ncbi:HET-domain-containing protein [Apiospora marii]|uniref:HET-domain-containing protein n=1 Tax=Apiospora marii TaxID=335849 RepID=A0ABR1SSR8_9PEZI
MDALCSRCAKIDWADLIRQANSEDPSRPRPLRWIGNRYERDDEEQQNCLAAFPVDTLASACAVCSLLSTLFVEQHRQGHRVERIEFTTHNDRLIGGAETLTPHFYGTQYMPGNQPRKGPWEPGYVLGLACQNPCNVSAGIRAFRKVNTRKANLALIRNWITDCRERHGDSCNAAVPGLITSLRVIDVHTGLIETAKLGCKYVALSYVWGKATSVEKGSASGQGKGLLGTAPPTIQDAAWLTRELGYQYLWIDRYCIPQDDPRAKHDQIQRMDLVYKQAQLTIIAAAGDGPEFGLPGIGDRPRQIQACAQLDNDLYLVEGDLICESIRDSRWIRRAWTYQESICSQKCIVFTEKEMMFQCKSVFCRETVYNSEQMDVFTVAGDNNPPEMWDHIIEYSGRQLTYKSDSLNGILGVFRLYRMSQTPVYHFWGIPFSASNDHSSAEEQFVASLCWLSSPDTSIHGYAEQCRRAEFPSWSWTGWKHAAAPYFAEGREPLKIRGSVSVPCSNDSSALQFEEFYKQRIRTDYLVNSTRFLIVECWTVELGVKIPRRSARDATRGRRRTKLLVWPEDKYGQEESRIVVNTLDVEDLDADMDLDTDSSGMQEPRWLALVFEDIEAFRSAGELHEGIAIVVRNYGDYYERFGNIKLENLRLRWISRPTQEQITKNSSPLDQSNSPSDPDSDSEPETDEDDLELTLEDWLPREFIWRKIKLG